MNVLPFQYVEVAEEKRLNEAREKGDPLEKVGAHISVSDSGAPCAKTTATTGNAWDYFTHDQARSRVYRWGEDGLAGRRVSANVALLGQLLQHYGPEAKGVQESLQLAVERVLAKNWPNERAENWKPSPKAGHIPEVYDQLRALAPKDEEHRMMQSENPRSASEYSAAALADYCTKRRNDIAADTIRDDFLGDEYFRQLGPVFTRERDVSNDLLCSCVVRVWCNFFGP